MPTATTFAEQMVAKLQTLLLQSAGLASVNVDGVSTSFEDVEAKLAYWTKKAAAEKGKSRTTSTIKLGGV